MEHVARTNQGLGTNREDPNSTDSQGGASTIRSDGGEDAQEARRACEAQGEAEQDAQVLRLCAGRSTERVGSFDRVRNSFRLESLESVCATCKTVPEENTTHQGARIAYVNGHGFDHLYWMANQEFDTHKAVTGYI
jgi:hypothetical protein